MANAERPTGKRSRFDQMEPEPKRSSRFDRRSRSPPARRSEARERSPLRQDGPPEPRKSPSAAAAAAAARISAQVQARQGIQHVDVPPINKPEQAPSPPPPVRMAAPSAGGGSTYRLSGEVYVADGDYIMDIDINNLRNRYVLTKSTTQKMIKDKTGADVTTRGSYCPNKSLATPSNPPLYLHVTSTTREGLDAAVAKINDLVQQELPQLVDERRFRRRKHQEQPPVERDEYGRRKWPEEKVFVGLDPMPGFNLRAQIVGSGGSYVKHIQSETGCRVQIKGRGSGYLEVATNSESEEEMFLHVTGPEPKMVEKGKELCKDLVTNVRDQYEEFKSRPPRGHDRGSYGDHYRGGRSHDQPYSSYGRHGSEQSTTAGNPSASGANASANSADWSQYAAQYYNGSDPYAAYGGYQNYMAWYQYYYGSQSQGQGTAPGQAAPGQTAPGQAAPGQPTVPPPPSEAPFPPPPPPSDAAPAPPLSASPPPPGNGYNSV